MKLRFNLTWKERLFLTFCGLTGVIDGTLEALSFGTVDINLQYLLLTSNFANWADSTEQYDA